MRKLQIIPAIDILGGSCVRLYQGRFQEVVRYRDDPVAQAQEFEQAGATRIHVVDLDAARGEGHNRRIIGDICSATQCSIETGGGIRREDDVRQLRDAGVRYLIVGTVLVTEPERVAQWVSEYPDTFIAGLDAKNHRVQITGWQDDGIHTVADMLQRIRIMGISQLIFTNIEKDGTLAGPDIAATNEVARQFSPGTVILSGGIGKLEDCREVARKGEDNLVGIIVGKAIYNQNLTLTEAYRIFV